MPTNVESYKLQETEEHETLEPQEKGNGKKLSLKERTQRRKPTGKGKKIMKLKDKEQELSTADVLFDTDEEDEAIISYANVEAKVEDEGEQMENLHEEEQELKETRNDAIHHAVKESTAKPVSSNSDFLSSKILILNSLTSGIYKAEIGRLSTINSGKLMVQFNILVKGGLAKYPVNAFLEPICVKGNMLSRLLDAFEDVDIETYNDLLSQEVWISVDVVHKNGNVYENVKDFADAGYEKRQLKVDRYGRFIWE